MEWTFPNTAAVYFLENPASQSLNFKALNIFEGFFGTNSTEFQLGALDAMGAAFQTLS